MDLSHLDFSKGDANYIQEKEFFDKTAAVVNRVFSVVSGLCPAFRNAWPTERHLSNARIEWTKAFMQAGLKDSRLIENGLSNLRLKGGKFVPSCGEFIALCKSPSPQMGLKSPQDAFKEAASKMHPLYGEDKRWSHVAIHHAALNTGRQSLQLPLEKALKIFERNYEIALSQWLNGELQDIPKALPEKPDDDKITKSLGDSYLQKLKEILKS